MVEVLIEIADPLGCNSEAVLTASATDFIEPIEGNDAALISWPAFAGHSRC
jgi:hypothetical protein